MRVFRLQPGIPVALALLTLASCAGPRQIYKPLGVAPVRQGVSEAQGSVAKASGYATSLDARVKALEAEKNPLALGIRTDLDLLTRQLLDAGDTLKTTQLRITELETKEADRTRLLNEANVKLEDALKYKSAYHRLRFGVAAGLGIILGVVALIAVPPAFPINLYIAGGVALAAGLGAWFLIPYLL